MSQPASPTPHSGPPSPQGARTSGPAQPASAAASASAAPATKPGQTPQTAERLSTVVGWVKGWVERMNTIWVEAQVIELRRRAGAYMHFLTLRDTSSEVSAQVTATTAVLDQAGPLTEGTTVLAKVRPRVWNKTARLSFECFELRIAGEGQLLAELEKLKRKLQAEGLFSPARKKPLPMIPRLIGLITGADSAAERDVLTNTQRRWPSARFRVRHALVQGPSSVADVTAALAELDADPQVDLIVIARGGGSLENLLPFSDEGLVRAVAAASTPVVSAIGHEPDTPILDLVADLRASTPTDAAKRIVPDAAEERHAVAQLVARARTAIIARVSNAQAELNQLVSRPVLSDPSAALSGHTEQLEMMRFRLDTAIDRLLDHERTDVAHAVQRIRAMSPKATLERGYAIVADADNASVTSVTQTEPGDQLMVFLSDGRLVVEVDDTLPGGSGPAGADDPPAR
ncbi:exodeoxyribonuclease VII large subunit [Propionibacterium freudenreichii]|uniref:Exodeoxyribonuclease 7 large subunit n=1 Tax=Propionibacterium freudenreichii subsp. shermanii (strain ATCC 9614 / DSM 4902 / CIP 103027 / NCIMB 8099 / CIRM-BIA1) TaxID=754252 RepID=D7GF98_PROFC|nr:exodeoxyribonuclease VII large subunit [Propionibacterium freudenreichii]PWM99455.1 MAG: exodeoxyribonuclease VII large subunit [Propionibacterium sp.]MCQ1998614.1 exodeoxyribonuclease VII large subunit [Propionibacterium freudenreichii]MCT2974689.1 exodeoxyribonuclease VII large subunit [Propionibacterium freudenreichii]MCT2976980.1 exodeoxyribonuclease VII large subunit [Propionibacterium freudenreichii]MCT2981240.1 exodeoxyribonuclease VII large subunit [Propionibacterium freudenreichii]